MSSKLSTLLANNPLLGNALARADGFYVRDASATGSDQSKGITIDELIKALAGAGAQANASGDTTVTPYAASLQHVEAITFSGSGSTTRKVVLATSQAPTAGCRLVVRCALPATADITVEFRNATTGGTLITSIVTDGTGDDCTAEFYYDGSAWAFLRFTYPANA